MKRILLGFVICALVLVVYPALPVRGNQTARYGMVSYDRIDAARVIVSYGGPDGFLMVCNEFVSIDRGYTSATSCVQVKK